MKTIRSGDILIHKQFENLHYWIAYSDRIGYVIFSSANEIIG